MPRNNRIIPKPVYEAPVKKTNPVTDLPMVKNVQPTPSLGQIVKEGMAFGVGNAIAHNVVNRLFSGSSTVVPIVPVVLEKTEYVKCMQETNDKEYCARYDLE